MFDFDGTLIDTMSAYSKLAAEVINKYFGINKKLAYKKYKETTGLPFEKQLESIFPGKEHKQKREKCAKEYVNRKVVDRKIVEALPMKGAIELLKSLKKRGFKQFILSGTERKIISNFLKRNKISHIPIFGKESGTKKEILMFLRKKFKNKKFLLVSDSLNDLLLPVDIKVGIYKTKKEKEWLLKANPHYLIRDLKKIKNILLSLNEQ